MSEPTTADRETMMARLAEMVHDHLDIARPGLQDHMRKLQDDLMPIFMDVARQAWRAASPIPLRTGILPNEPSHPIYRYLDTMTESSSIQIDELNSILEKMGVHALLDDVASSPEVAMMGELPVDAYETRLLRAIGHPNPSQAVAEALREATNSALLRSSDAKLQEAREASLKVHSQITVIVNVGLQYPAQVGPAGSAPGAAAVPGYAGTAGPAVEKPKKRKLFSGLGKLFSGLVLLTGNAMVIPSVAMAGVAALPILGSFAGGIAAVGNAAGYLLREGE